MDLEKKLKPREFDEDLVERSAEILLEAEDIRKDTVLMNAVEEFLKEKKRKITTIQQLKDKANNFANEEQEESDEEAPPHKFKEKKLE